MEEQSAPAQPLTLWALLILSLCPVAAFLGDLWNWTPGAAACALLAPALLAAAVRLEPRSLAVVAVLSGVCCVVETLLRQTHPGATLGLGYCLFAAVTLASGATLAGAGAALDRREIGRLRWQKDQLVRELYERERILRDLSADGPALETPVELATAAERISARNLQDPPGPKQTVDHEDNISYALLLLTLQDISQRISTNLDLESLVPTIISTARASLDCESCQVWLWNAREQTLRNPLPERSRDQHEYSPRVATGMGRWVIEKRQILTRSSVEEDLALHPLFEEEDGQLPDAVAPLAVGGELIGLLVVDRTAEDTSRFLRLLYILADIYALGIKNAQLFHRVQEMARRDGLTGLLNHASFREKLDDLLATSTEPQQPVAIIMGDIDHFKKINDSRGHLAGDEVLRKQG
ncbi:MAG: sensor domain-containing diguanylate cyclase, partial [Planctomycetaceae bacterium]|nr:sensor domain-containing diguanylate cyclase [Planctomycetaceae bacterium]